MADDPIAEPARPADRVIGPDAGRAATPAWRFRGYELRPSDFNTAMVHFYRGEIQRSNTWRARLDSTTNWAVITTGAGISFALSAPDHHYAGLVLTSVLVTLFLWIEARRYRYYELWSYRVRLMEVDFFAAMLVPPFTPRADWAENLATSLQTPRFPISMWEALGRRLRRNYLWIFVVLGVASAIKALVHPTPAATWAEFVARFELGPVPAPVMFGLGLVHAAVLVGLAFGTAGLRHGSEVAPEIAGTGLIRRLWPR